MTDSEETLIRSACQGNQAAFEELVRRTSRLVFGRLYVETGDAHRAEDLLQETLLIAFRNLPQLKDPSGFRSWLLAIAQNVVIDAARRDKRKRRAAPPRADANSLHQVPDISPGPREQAENAEMRDQVLAVLRSIPEQYRHPLTLRYVSGSNYDTICTELGMSNGALRGLLHRGLKMLRAKLEQIDFEHPGGSE
jgi:RNA polymerase sigma-70 factor (ECF subfamily)